MIITLIGVILIILGFVGIKFGLKFRYSEGLETGSCVAIITGFCWILTCSTLILVNTFTGERDIYTDRLERECIVKQLEIINSDYEHVSRVTVMQNINNWNQKVYTAKYWSNNLWTSWFWNKKYVDSLEYIELED